MHIDAYSFGEIVVDGTTYTSDLIIYPDRVQANWRRERGHHLQPGDLADVVEAQPGHLIIGTGASDRMTVSEDAKRFLRRHDLSFEVLPTGEACRAFNQQSSGVAALHLTC